MTKGSTGLLLGVVGIAIAGSVFAAQPHTELEKLTRQCNAKNADACREVARIYSWGEKVKEDRDKAIVFFQKACNLGHAEGCYRLGRFADTKRSNSKTSREGEIYGKQALNAYKKSCELGDANGCAYLGTKYLNGSFVELDRNKGLALLEKACNDGSAQACWELAYRYDGSNEYENYVEKNDKKAFAYYAKGCENKWGMCCSIVGKKLLNRPIFMPGHFKAYDYFAKACDLNDRDACFLLANKHRSIMINQRAKEFSEKACALGHAKACTFAAMEQDNMTKRREYIFRACALSENECRKDLLPPNY